MLSASGVVPLLTASFCACSSARLELASVSVCDFALGSSGVPVFGLPSASASGLTFADKGLNKIPSFDLTFAVTLSNISPHLPRPAVWILSAIIGLLSTAVRKASGVS